MVIDASAWFYPAIFASVWLSPVIFIINVLLEVFS